MPWTVHMYNPFYERAVSAVNVSVISPRQVVSGYVDGAPQLGKLLHIFSVLNSAMHRDPSSVSDAPEVRHIASQ